MGLWVEGVWHRFSHTSQCYFSPLSTPPTFPLKPFGISVIKCSINSQRSNIFTSTETFGKYLPCRLYARPDLPAILILCACRYQLQTRLSARTNFRLSQNKPNDKFLLLLPNHHYPLEFKGFARIIYQKVKKRPETIQVYGTRILCLECRRPGALDPLTLFQTKLSMSHNIPYYTTFL